MNHHEIAIRSPRDLVDSSAPVILQRSDEDFLAAILERLRSEQGRGDLRADIASVRNAQNVLKLYQPIQRQFHVALIEAWCQQPGNPRIDPAKVDSAGMVLRRVRQDPSRGTVMQGWMRAGGQLRGWVEVDRLGGDKADPAPGPRLARRATGSVQVDRALAPIFAQRDDAILAEHVTPMFIAPPDVCTDARRTLFYGLVQTSSSELSEAPPDPFENFGADSRAFRDHLVEHLRGDAVTMPLAGEMLTPAWFEAFELGNADAIAQLAPNVAAAIGVTATAVAVKRFILLLRQLAVEFDAFGDSTPSTELLGELDKIALPLVLQPTDVTQRTVSAGQFLRQASQILLERDDAIAALEMPVSWPALDAGAQSGLGGKLSAALAERFRSLQGKAGRFDEPDAQYMLRAFVRLKPEGGCPAKTLWSDYSQPFVIAPWYEGSGAAPVQIPLPDLSNRALLKSLKPNVAFVVPPSLQALLGNDPKDMLQGKGSKPGPGLTLGWICGFNIPIITICAFIVLNIFLSLFDLFFRWMLFFKICIPYPKKGGSNG